MKRCCEAVSLRIKEADRANRSFNLTPLTTRPFHTDSHCNMSDLKTYISDVELSGSCFLNVRLVRQKSLLNNAALAAELLDNVGAATDVKLRIHHLIQFIPNWFD